MSKLFKGFFSKDSELDELDSDAERIEPPPAQSSQRPPPRSTPPPFDANSLWEARGITAAERERVARAEQLIRSLPAQTPADQKREIVAASLKAFDVSIGDIVAAATREIDALRTYIEDGEERTDQFAAQAEGRIAVLEGEIEKIRAAIDKASLEQARLAEVATSVIQQIEPVVAFFAPEEPAFDDEESDEDDHAVA